MGNSIQLNQDDSEMSLIHHCEYYDNGHIKEKYTVRLSDQVKHGRVFRYYEVEDPEDEPNTLWEQGFYKDGKEHGLWAGFWKDSQALAAVGSLDMGKRTGLWMFYDETGEFERWELYDKESNSTKPSFESDSFYDYIQLVAEEYLDDDIEDDEERQELAEEKALDDIQMKMRRIPKMATGVVFDKLIRGIEQFF